MRHFIANSIIAIGMVGLMATSGSAQFRRPMRPPVQQPSRAMPRPAYGFPSAFNPYAHQAGSLVRAAQGSISPRGVFSPTGTGPFTLAARGRFEPQPGTFTPLPTGRFTLNALGLVNPRNGNIVASPYGNILLQQRGEFQPSAGAFTKTTSGSLNFSNGRFIPGANGASSVSSRGLFVPSKGTFVPSPYGQYVVTTRETYNPATKMFSPSADGSFLYTTRGTFISDSAKRNPFLNPAVARPSNPYLAWGSTAAFNPANPFSPLSPFNNSFLNTSIPNSAFFGGNSYLPSPYGAYGAYGNPGANAGNAGFSSGFPTSGSYTTPPYFAPANYGGGNGGAFAPQIGAGAMQPPANGGNANGAQTVNAAPDGNQGKQPSYATPSDDEQWPLAFRLLSPLKKQQLLDPLEAQLSMLKTQADSDKVNPRTVRDTRDTVDNLRQWLRSRRLDMAEGTYDEANELLRRLDRGLANMKY